VQVQYPITFLYYRDLESVIPFYRDVLGLDLEIDQGWSKIFAVHSGKSYVGLVDESAGSMSSVDEKGVLLTFVVDDVDVWHEHMAASGVEGLTEPKMQEEIGVYCFFCEDPGGYRIEIQKFV